MIIDDNMYRVPDEIIMVSYVATNPTTKTVRKAFRKFYGSREDAAKEIDRLTRDSPSYFEEGSIQALAITTQGNVRRLEVIPPVGTTLVGG